MCTTFYIYIYGRSGTNDDFSTEESEEYKDDIQDE